MIKIKRLNNCKLTTNKTKLIVFVIMLLLFGSFVYGLTVTQNIENMVGYIKKMIFTPDGTSNTQSKVVIDGENGNISMSGNLKVNGNIDVIDGYIKINGYDVLTGETDPTVKQFAKKDLPVCGSGYVLTSYNGKDFKCVKIEKKEDIKDIIIVDYAGGRRWSNETYAKSCKEYRYPTKPHYKYAGSIGDGVYYIKPDGVNQAFKVYCDMTTDGGGWTQVIRIVPNANNNTFEGNMYGRITWGDAGDIRQSFVVSSILRSKIGEKKVYFKSKTNLGNCIIKINDTSFIHSVGGYKILLVKNLDEQAKGYYSASCPPFSKNGQVNVFAMWTSYSTTKHSVKAIDGYMHDVSAASVLVGGPGEGVGNYLIRSGIGWKGFKQSVPTPTTSYGYREGYGYGRTVCPFTDIIYAYIK